VPAPGKEADIMSCLGKPAAEVSTYSTSANHAYLWLVAKHKNPPSLFRAL
jgi:hypothetical protein